jgi:tRNA uridine 5-carboxymethylaminomethyl modification enzyme
MFTSRAEFRLHLRIDNADTRLTPHGRALGLIDDEAWAAYEAKQARAAAFTTLLETTKLSEEDAAKLQHELGEYQGTQPQQPFLKGDRVAQLLKRPHIAVEQLVPVLLAKIAAAPALAPWTAALETANTATTGTLPAWVRNEMKTVETSIKFAGYLAQQQRSIERLRADEARPIPEWFDYTRASGLSREMVEKLSRIRPMTIGQASRIAGVTPAAVSLIQCFLEIQARGKTA